MLKKALKELQREKQAASAAREKKKKGKSVPGKNLSKNSQCDGNDDDSGPSQRTNSRRAAKSARETIAQQSLLIDPQLPKGDKPYEPAESSESDIESDQDDENEFDLEEEENESMDDDFQSAQSFQPNYGDLGDSVDHCWVESFDLELNSKRIDAFSIPSKIN